MMKEIEKKRRRKNDEVRKRRRRKRRRKRRTVRYKIRKRVDAPLLLNLFLCLVSHTLSVAKKNGLPTSKISQIVHSLSRSVSVCVLWGGGGGGGGGTGI